MLIILLFSCSSDRKWTNPCDPNGQAGLTLSPSNLLIESLDYQRIQLTWTDNSRSETAFQISRKTGDGEWQENLIQLSANVMTYTDTVSAVNVNYAYRVRAVFDEVFSAPLEKIFYHRYDLSQPDSLQAILTSANSLKLSWKDSNPCEEGFFLDKKTDEGVWTEKYAQVNTNILTYIDSEINWGHTYQYRIYAFAGDTLSAKTAVLYEHRLTAPQNLTIEVLSETHLKLNWTNQNPETDGFRIARKTDDGEWNENYAQIDLSKRKKTKNLKTNTQYTWQDENAEINHHYYYKVTAFCNESNSQPALNDISFFINPVTDLTLSIQSANTVKLQWTDQNAFEEAFVIHRKVNNEAWQMNYAMVTHDTTYYDDHQTILGNQYTYQVQAKLGNALSNPTSAFLMHQISLTAPYNLTALPLTYNSVRLQWQDDNQMETGFRVARKVGEDNWEDSYITLPANTSQWVDSNAPAGNTYSYRLIALADSAQSQFTEITYHFQLNTPDELNMNPQSMTSIKLTWKDTNQYEQGYVISRKAGDDPWEYDIAFVPANSTEWTDSTAPHGDDYTYSVCAYSQDNRSAELTKTFHFALSAPMFTTYEIPSVNAFKINWICSNTFGNTVISRRVDYGEWDYHYAELDYNVYEFTDTYEDINHVYSYKISAKYMTVEAADYYSIKYHLPDFSSAVFTSFSMGSNSFANTQPIHNVSLDNYFVGRFEVTQGQWQAVMGTNPASGHGVGENYPVYNVSWYDALVYCNKLSIQKGLTPCYSKNGITNPENWGNIPDSLDADWNSISLNTSADGYRLPTEAEWEGVSRYGAMNMAYSGSNTLGDVGWYVNNSSGTTHLKGQKQANISKIHDMTGNVFEWCWDWYGAYDAGSSTNPLGADTGTQRIVRGGSYSSDTEPCMNVYRSQFSPEIRQSNIGLRLVRKNQFPLF